MKHDENNHWLALYLSGQYPGYYRMPNRFEIILKIRQLDGVNFSDTMLSLLKDKGDIEFYNTLLNTFESLHSSEDYVKLLSSLDVPEAVIRDLKAYPTKIQSKSIGFLTPFDDNKDQKMAIINSALPEDWHCTPFDLKSFEESGFLWEQIAAFLEKHSFYIVDLRSKKQGKSYNENVLLELGYILAKKKNFILIKNAGLVIPSDLQGVPYVEEENFAASEGDLGVEKKDEFSRSLKREIDKMIQSLTR